MIGAKPYTDVNWTRRIDQKTGRPIEYDPTKDIQAYAGVGNLSPGAPLKKVCPSILGGNNYCPELMQSPDQAEPNAMAWPKSRHGRISGRPATDQTFPWGQGFFLAQPCKRRQPPCFFAERLFADQSFATCFAPCRHLCRLRRPCRRYFARKPNLPAR
jgi:hypothetical protein